MTDLAKPPPSYEKFVERFPHLGAAWDEVRREEASLPLEKVTLRLVKLGIAIGTMQRGAVRSSVRKARAAGASDEQILGVVALAASNIGLPSSVTTFNWVSECLGGETKD